MSLDTKQLFLLLFRTGYIQPSLHTQQAVYSISYYSDISARAATVFFLLHPFSFICAFAQMSTEFKCQKTDYRCRTFILKQCGNNHHQKNKLSKNQSVTILAIIAAMLQSPPLHSKLLIYARSMQSDDKLINKRTNKKKTKHSSSYCRAFSLLNGLFFSRHLISVLFSVYVRGSVMLFLLLTIP